MLHMPLDKRGEKVIMWGGGGVEFMLVLFEQSQRWSLVPPFLLALKMSYRQQSFRTFLNTWLLAQH